MSNVNTEPVYKTPTERYKRQRKSLGGLRQTLTLQKDQLRSSRLRRYRYLRGNALRKGIQSVRGGNSDLSGSDTEEMPEYDISGFGYYHEPVNERSTCFNDLVFVLLTVFSITTMTLTGIYLMQP